MKKLSMRKVDLGVGYSRYEVMDGQNVIAKRVSHRDYVAAFVSTRNYKTQDPYVISKMFGRIDLFQAALRKTPADEIYAIAELSK